MVATGSLFTSTPPSFRLRRRLSSFVSFFRIRAFISFTRFFEEMGGEKNVTPFFV